MYWILFYYIIWIRKTTPIRDVLNRNVGRLIEEHDFSGNAKLFFDFVELYNSYYLNSIVNIGPIQLVYIAAIICDLIQFNRSSMISKRQNSITIILK